MPIASESHTIAQQVVNVACDLRGIVAMALGGSSASGLADSDSDVDIHVYWNPPLAEPEERAAKLAECADPGSVRVDIHSWGLEDHLAVNGRPVELVYLHLGDMRAQIDQAYSAGLDSDGYTTALLYIVAAGEPLHDPTGELGRLRQRLLAAYPEATRRVLLQHRTPLMQFYVEHLRLAQRRGDLTTVQADQYHLQTVFFNLLFALNRRYHPGEKRLLVHSERCALRPERCAERWAQTTRLAADDPALVEELGALAADLVSLIERHSGIEIPKQPW